MSVGPYRYSNLFFDYVDFGAYCSANRVLPVLRQFARISSVLDVGCGRGAWLAAWRELGVTDCLGIDGEYVDTTRLAIPRSAFMALDVAGDFALHRRFDLVQCLEVAEHISESRADTLVRNLMLHGDMIMFSAAVPGQGGEFHVNEQPYEYWRDKFSRHGYRLFDFLRPAIRDMRDVEPWYRFNTFLFANNIGLARLSRQAAKAEVLDDNPIVDYASLGWRIQTRILRLMPRHFVHELARLKHFMSSRKRPR